MCESTSPCASTEPLETGGVGEAKDTSGALLVGTLLAFMFVAADCGGVEEAGIDADADERENALGRSLALIEFNGSTLPAPITSGADGGSGAIVSWLLL